MMTYDQFGHTHSDQPAPGQGPIAQMLAPVRCRFCRAVYDPDRRRRHSPLLRLLPMEHPVLQPEGRRPRPRPEIMA